MKILIALFLGCWLLAFGFTFLFQSSWQPHLTRKICSKHSHSLYHVAILDIIVVVVMQRVNYTLWNAGLHHKVSKLLARIKNFLLLIVAKLVGKVVATGILCGASINHFSLAHAWAEARHVKNLCWLWDSSEKFKPEILLVFSLCFACSTLIEIYDWPQNTKLI